MKIKVEVQYTISGLPGMIYRELDFSHPASTNDIKTRLTNEVRDLFTAQGATTAPTVTIWSIEQIQKD